MDLLSNLSSVTLRDGCVSFKEMPARTIVNTPSAWIDVTVMFLVGEVQILDWKNFWQAYFIELQTNQSKFQLRTFMSSSITQLSGKWETLL